MEQPESCGRLATFLESGIYRFEDSNAVFVDPVRLLNTSYTRFRVSPSAYYSRFFKPQPSEEVQRCSIGKKRKRKVKKPLVLNERERAADRRHLEARPFLMKAHESLLKVTDLCTLMSRMWTDEFGAPKDCKSMLPGVHQSFIELGRLWQAPLYEITLNFEDRDSWSTPDTFFHWCNDIIDSQKLGCILGTSVFHSREPAMFPVFNNLVLNGTKEDSEAEFLDSRYVIPRESGFYMIHNIVPDSDSGFHLIVIDPPWENGSARQKSRYPTLPNKYFLSLPVQQFAHREGSLIALWVTNREKLRNFVEKELFPAWGVNHVATFYWLKVKSDGSLICDLDLFHHRPYECVLLGYCFKEAVDSEELAIFDNVQDEQVILSVPGDYSRKPPIEDLLWKYVPGTKPPRCIELFAREMRAGWLSWGNEPLHFQELRYFQ